jgi:hypothetical protein
MDDIFFVLEAKSPETNGCWWFMQSGRHPLDLIGRKRNCEANGFSVRILRCHIMPEQIGENLLD